MPDTARHTTTTRRQAGYFPSLQVMSSRQATQAASTAAATGTILLTVTA